MHRTALILVGFFACLAVGLVACASGEPPPRHAGGPADPTAPEGPVTPSPFASSASSASSATTSAPTPMHHEGMEMAPEAGK